MLRGKLSKFYSQLKNEDKQFLSFLKAKYPLFHNSNFFYRDFQYGVRKYLELKDIDITYGESDKLALQLVTYFEEKEIFIPVSKQAWTINYPEFVTTVPGDPL
ncbi:MAG TPA: hypothetical protein VKD08_04525 [Ignavibacteriaceae bacterium]|jgi:hypothetical protein|nr:hypothetical protein [Ignavibacteriaceae bacterium]